MNSILLTGSWNGRTTSHRDLCGLRILKHRTPSSRLRLVSSALLQFIVSIAASPILTTRGADAEVDGAPKLPDQFEIQAIDTYLTHQVRQRNREGLSVAIYKDGKPVLVKGYGKQSLESGEPVQTETLFAIGSVSKQFTCAAIFLLAEDGRLSLTDPVATYYPNLARARDITLLDLMHHVSGYPDYYPLDFVDRRMKRPKAPDDLLQEYAGGKLDFEPGTKYSYSNTGYILLARVVEKVSGKPFGQLLAERIFQPLGMTHTVYEANPSDPRLARGYTTFALSKPEPALPESVGWLGGAGGIYSTPSDLARWNLALMDGRLLKPESWARFIQPRILKDGRNTQYGCGVGTRIQNGRPIVIHTGAVSGFNTYNAMVPSTRSCVIMTSNIDGGLGNLPSQVFDLLTKETTVVPTVKGPPATEMARKLFRQFRLGRVDRKAIADEFNYFLTPKRLTETAGRLKPYGEPTAVELLSSSERGGMEVTRVRLKFKTRSLSTLMYRRPDGIVEQFFVEADR